MAAPEPTYAVILHDNDFEVRDYPREIVAQVTVGGDQDAAGSAGFRLLAAYIFGGNAGQRSIAMTAPVVQSRDGGEKIPMTAPVVQSKRDGSWTVRFIMPPGYTLDTLPVPNDPRVTLVALPPTRFAVVRFSGLAFEHDVLAHTEELRAFIATHQLRPAGPSLLARYNPPWTPWFMRRNEVMVPLEGVAPAQ